MSIVAYVNGKEVSEMPKSCAYMATAKIYTDGKELTANELALTCELSSNKWNINLEKMSEIPDKINLYFKVKK